MTNFTTESVVFINKLNFEYQIHASYVGKIWRHNFSVMFIPKDNHRQKIESLDITVKDCPKYALTMDNFGNKKLYGLIQDAHDTFDVSIKGVVTTGHDVCEEFIYDEDIYAMYRCQTSLTRPGKQIRALHDELSPRLNAAGDHGPYDKTHIIFDAVYERMKYVQGVTQVHAKAEEAFAQGEGVCQDYAHIMLSLLRMEKIACRYVTGMMKGEGASHAWVEVLCRGYWYGFDPTNHHLVDDDYIKVACGRDSLDCPVIKGTFYGMAQQNQTEKVIVYD